VISWPEVAGVTIAPATLDEIRARAPKLVTSGATLDFKTLTPERGGLFDYRVFGPGTVIDAPIVDDDAPYQPRNVTFGRLVLAHPIGHLHELAVLPPDLRPLQRLDDDRWQSSSINDLYRRVIQCNERGDEVALRGALLALFDNEHQATPVLDALVNRWARCAGSPVISRRGCVPMPAPCVRARSKRSRLRWAT